MTHLPSRRRAAKPFKTPLLRPPHLCLHRPVSTALAFCFVAAALVTLQHRRWPARRDAIADSEGHVAAAPPPPPRPIDDPGCWIFQHLHKSGGMTIRKIMNPPKGNLEEGGDIVGFGTDEWRRGAAYRDVTLLPQLLDEDKYRIATGGYTGALRLSPRLAGGCRFFTVFRHPVNRLVSAYYWCRSQKHNWDPLCATAVSDAATMSLVGFAKHWGNYAARQMAMSFVPAEDVMRYVDEVVGDGGGDGTGDDGRPAPMLDGVSVEDIPSWYLLKMYLRGGYRRPRGGGGGGGEGVTFEDPNIVNDDAALLGMMDSIQRLVRDNFTAIGVVEEFDASMALFDAAGVIPGKQWSATYKKLGAANKNEARETEGSIVLRNALLSEEVKKYLSLDILLYDHAVAVFHDLVWRRLGK